MNSKAEPASSADHAPPQSAPPGNGHGDLLLLLMPPVFVFLWSTGFVVTKAGLPYADPLTFLVLRFVAVIALMTAVSLAWRAPWPQGRMALLHVAVSGALLHGGYLGGVFTALKTGMAAGLVALICGMQPILTAFVAAPVLRERVTSRQWAGLVLGLAGVALVLERKLSLEGLSLVSVAAAGFALVSFTMGAVYQKRFCPKLDLRSGSVIQFIGALVLVAPFALLLEDNRVEWTGTFILSLAWLVLVLSIGAISLLTLLLRRGAVTRVASFQYLVPPTTAALAWLMFGETFAGLALVGMVMTVVAVALVNAPAQK